MKVSIALLLLLVSVAMGDNAFGQSDTTGLAWKKPLVTGSLIAVGTGSLIGLNQLWYADFDRSSFHWFDDSREWNQMDKLGHVFSSYQLGMAAHKSLNWAGVPEKKALIWGGSAGFLFLLGIETLDGFSAEWGASASDLTANAAGTALYIGQELIWKEQRVQPKFSFQPSPYASLAPDKLGSSELEQLFKDYNAQTYWLSLNLHSFMPESKLPVWLNLAIGHGSEGMISANPPQTEGFASSAPERYRQWYLSLDADLYRIPVRSRFLKTTLRVLSLIKIPAPGIEFSNGKVQALWIAF